VLLDHVLTRARHAHAQVVTGRFGADIQVTLTNDGPVTFWLLLPGSSGRIATPGQTLPVI